MVFRNNLVEVPDIILEMCRVKSGRMGWKSSLEAYIRAYLS